MPVIEERNFDSSDCLGAEAKKMQAVIFSNSWIEIFLNCKRVTVLGNPGCESTEILVECAGFYSVF